MSEVLNVIQTLSETNDFILPTAILLLDYYNKGNKLARGGVWGTIIRRMILNLRCAYYSYLDNRVGQTVNLYLGGGGGGGLTTRSLQYILMIYFNDFSISLTGIHLNILL